MHVGAVDVGAPGDDVFGVRELLRLGAQLAAQHGDQRVTAAAGANGAVELRGAQTIKKSVGHTGKTQDAHVAGVGIRKNGLRSELTGDFAEAGYDLVVSFVPGDAGEI